MLLSKSYNHTTELSLKTKVSTSGTHFNEISVHYPISMSSYYTILGVGKNATELDLKRSYRRKLLLLHPDKQNQRKDHKPQPGTVESLQLVREAYQILIDPTKRANYDKLIDIEHKKDSDLGAELASGLETVSLDDFNFNEYDVTWLRDCPRCKGKNSFEITEDDLVKNISLCEGVPDDFDGAYNMVIQCSSCTLWLRVKYYDLDEEDE